jgi:hypothetical protein
VRRRFALNRCDLKCFIIAVLAMLSTVAVAATAPYQRTLCGDILNPSSRAGNIAQKRIIIISMTAPASTKGAHLCGAVEHIQHSREKPQEQNGVQPRSVWTPSREPTYRKRSLSDEGP